MKTRAFLAVAAAVAMIGLSGCPYDLYEIDMRPDGQKIERAVTVKHCGEGRIEGPMPPTIVRQSKGIYQGGFPDEVEGGSGRYLRLDSGLGGASFYLERVRGDDDQATVLESQMKAVDRLVDLLIGWAEQGLGEHKEFPKLRAFMDKDLRKDLKNVGLFFWMMDAADRSVTAAAEQDETKAGINARFAQYLIERSYLKVEDAPSLVGLLDGPLEMIQKAASVTLIRKTLIDKVGLTEQALIDKLTSPPKEPEAPGSSFFAYVEQTSEFKKARAEWEAKQAAAAASRPDTRKEEGDVFTVVVCPAFHTLARAIPILNASPDLFEITLHTKQPPVHSNGRWDAKAGTLSWRFSFEKRTDTVPAICYAAWADPDEKAQAAHFGRVVLEGGELIQYCLWHNSLTPQDAKEWDGLIGGLTPASGDTKPLGEFHFSSHPVATQPEEKDVKGVTLILDALRTHPSASQPAGNR